MDFTLFILMFLQVGWCEVEENFVTKTAEVGENVILSCNRHTSLGIATFFWVRLVPGSMPEILGKAFSFDTDDLSRNSHSTTKVEPGLLSLHFPKTKMSDTGFYYCIKLQKYNISFSKGVFLRIKGPEPDFTRVIQHSPSDAVYAGDSLTLQCSVFSERENKKCSDRHRVFWFRVTSEESHPRLIFGQSDSDGDCDTSPEALSQQSCVYTFFKDNVTSSDAGAYYCAVAACGKIAFGNGTKLDIEGVSTTYSEKNNTLIFLLCAVLAVGLIITTLLICAIRKKSCNCASVSLETNAERACNEQQNQQINQDSLVYSTVTVTRRKADRAGRKNAPTKAETIYTDVY
ncbi:uncharacterized protein LOC121643278 isoform X2 [Melanotaenia boesemani]|uniref:uncharacterized protein LOC121643278 isoform X2 n=1 Tax=Melanotaenia boesemani TaxID=1250792 RepID=UPI001C0514ED|nr:uncharacterized protein LOC121643278 isoform X2 [Melanotaenia boesemani]